MSSGAQQAQFYFPTGTDIYSTKVDSGDAIIGESHALPSAFPSAFTLFLDYVPQTGTVVVNGGAYAYTSSPTPGLNQFTAIFSGTQAGLLTFNGANSPDPLSISYTANGDIVKAFFFNDLQQSVETIENFIGSGLGITGTFLPLAGGTVVGDIVMNGADVVPQSSGSSSLGAVGTPFSEVVAISVSTQTVEDTSSTASINFSAGLLSGASTSGIDFNAAISASLAGGNSAITFANNQVVIDAPSSQLSVLVSGTEFTGDVNPGITSAYDLGSSVKRWGTLFADAIDTPGFDARYVQRVGDSMLGNLEMSGSATVKTNQITNNDSVNLAISASGDASISANTISINSVYTTDLNSPAVSFGAAASVTPLQILVNVPIAAGAPSVYDIGSATYPFKDIYANNVIGLNLSGNFVSRSGDSMSGDLVMTVGATGTQPTIYVENIASLSGVGILNVDTGQLNVTASNNMAFNIGSSGIQKLQIGMSQIYFSDNLLPSSDSVYDAGGPTNYIKDLYARNIHASGIASGVNIFQPILTDPMLSGSLTGFSGSTLGTSGNPIGTIYATNIISNVSSGIYVSKAGDLMYGSLTMSGSGFILAANSGTTDIGTAANPFGTIYVNNIQSTGANGQYVRLIGDTMSGPLGVANINSTGAFVLSGTSTINMYGSQITDQAQQITLQTDTGAIILDAQTELQLLNNGANRAVVNTSGVEYWSNLFPEVSGTRTVGTAARPFAAIYADYIVPTAVSGTGNFVLKVGDTMIGNLNFASGIGIQLVQSGTSDIGSAASPLRGVYSDNFYVNGAPILGGFVAVTGGTMTGDLTLAGANIYATGNLTVSNGFPGSINVNAVQDLYLLAGIGGVHITGSNNMIYGSTTINGGGGGVNINGGFEGVYISGNSGPVSLQSSQSMAITSLNGFLLDTSATSLNPVIKISTAPTTYLDLLGSFRVSGNTIPAISGTYSVGTIASPFSGAYFRNINGIAASQQVYNEVPAGLANGINTNFYTIYTPVSNTARLYRAGLRQTPGGVDYTLSGSGLTFAVAPISGDNILIDYERAIF